MKGKKVLVKLLMLIVMVTFCVPGLSTVIGVADSGFDDGAYSGANQISQPILLADTTDADEQFKEMTNQILNIVNNYVIKGLMVVATIVFVIFGIINGVKFAKSTEEEARQKAKKNLIGWGVGVVITFAMIWLLPLFLDFLVALFPVKPLK